MPFIIDEKDVNFCVFDWLNAGELAKLEKFKDHNEELFRMILTEGIKFAKNEIDPLQVKGDQQGCHLEDGVVKTPEGFKEAYQLFAQNGFIGIDIPTTYGGQGLPNLISVSLYEAFNASCVPFTMYAGLTRGSAFLIESFGSDEIKNMFCAKMYDGTWAGTMCLTEPSAGSAVGDLKTTATKNDDGTYNIVGNKIFISGGDQDITPNIIHLVLARVEGDVAGTKGISLFAVPKFWVNPDGSVGEHNDVNCVNIEHKMGIKASSTCSLNFGENGKCRGFLVGEQSKGMRYMFQMMNEARLLCGSQGQAIAATAYENAVKYAKERVQGGDKVITEYPDVRRNIALMKSWIEGMRGLLLMTAKYIDISHYSEDAEEKEKAQNRADLLTPICKAYCSDTGFKVTELAMQVLGGYGYCAEYPIEQYMRDVKISSIYEGTNGIQSLDLIGRKLALKQGQLFREFYEDLTTFAGEHEGHAEVGSDVQALKAAADTVGQVAMKFAEWGMGGDIVTPQLFATPFLEMCGDVCVAHVLLSQAVLADEKIKGGSDEAFYRNKIRTARFFARNVLPRVKMRAKEILTADKSALELEL